jgi:hypothetical protein
VLRWLDEGTWGVVMLGKGDLEMPSRVFILHACTHLNLRAGRRAYSRCQQARALVSLERGKGRPPLGPCVRSCE